MFEMFFAFLPMFSGYIFSGIGLDLIVLAIAAVYTLKEREKFLFIDKKKKNFLLLFVCVIIKDMLIVFLGESDSSESFHKLLALVTYIVFFLILLERKFEHEKFYKWLKWSGVLYIIGLIYHLIIIYLYNMPVKGISIIPGYEFSNINEPNRPRSFFGEPAAFAQAMLPLLFYSLHRKDYKWAFVATFSIFMSSSATGVLLAAVLWFIEFIMVAGNKKHKFLIVMLFLVAGAFLIQTEIAKNSLSIIQGRLTGGGSTSIRVFLGFEILGTMKPWDFLIGTLYNKPYDYVINNIGLFGTNSITQGLMAFGENYFFMNAFSGLIFRYGLIGLFLYFRIYRGKMFNKKYAGRALAIMTVFEMFGDSMLFNSYYFFIMLILFYLTQEKEIKNEGIAY